MYWKLQFYATICLILPVTNALTVGPLEELQNQFQGVDGPPQFDINVVQTPECREDLEHWTSALQGFLGTMTMTCDDDQECELYKSNLSTSNMFAAQQLDSFGRIPTALLTGNNLWQGSWEECLAIRSPIKASYRTQFCWQKVGTPVLLQLIGAKQFSPEMCKMTELSVLLASWSTCMPRSCPDQDITALFQSLNRENSTLYMFCDNECRPTGPPKKDAGFWVMIAIMAVAGVLMIVSSLVDYCTDYPDERYKQLRNGCGMRCLLAFSVYTNGSQLLSVKKIPGQIDSLHCIRVFSMTWVMVGHTVLQYMYGDDLAQVIEANNYFLNLAFTNAFFSVDSFLFIGGLLLTFLFIKDIDRKPSNLKSGSYWFLYYLHRILRLSPPYYLFLGFTVVFFDFLTVGPTKMQDITTMGGCHMSWWRNLLYVNNLWDLENMCMGHAWYLALDMQIHIFAPLFLIPLAIHYIGGIISGIILIAISSALNYWAFYKWDLPATFLGFLVGTGTVDLTATMTYQQYIYFASWVRYTPYIIGGWTGYFLYQMRKRNRKLRIHWLIAIALWICAILIGIGCVYGLFDYVKGKALSKFARASYYNWSRIGWSIALAWVVIACEHNLAGPIKLFMEQAFWAPFSRLTYCAYLTHFILISVIFAMSRQPLHFVNTADVYISGALPVFGLSYFASFIWSCAFEMPSLKLEKMLVAACFGGRAPRQHQEQKQHEDKTVNDKSSVVKPVESYKKRNAWSTDDNDDTPKGSIKNAPQSSAPLVESKGIEKPPIAPKPTVLDNTSSKLITEDDSKEGVYERV